MIAAARTARLRAGPFRSYLLIYLFGSDLRTRALFLFCCFWFDGFRNFCARAVASLNFQFLALGLLQDKSLSVRRSVGKFSSCSKIIKMHVCSVALTSLNMSYDGSSTPIIIGMAAAVPVKMEQKFSPAFSSKHGIKASKTWPTTRHQTRLICFYNSLHRVALFCVTHKKCKNGRERGRRIRNSNATCHFDPFCRAEKWGSTRKENLVNDFMRFSEPRSLNSWNYFHRARLNRILRLEDWWGLNRRLLSPRIIF